MPFPYEIHEEGCSEATPCRNCQGAAYLRDDLKLSAEVIIKFYHITGSTVPVPPVESEKDKRSIDDIFGNLLSLKLRQALWDDGIHTLGDLKKHTLTSFKQVPGVGPRAVDDTLRALAAVGEKFRDPPPGK